MTYRVIWTEYASSRLSSIYYFAALSSETFAEKILDDIDTKVQQLTEFPNSGAKEESLKAFTEEYRYLVSGYCKVIYRTENASIVIVNVFDTRQDPSKMQLG